VAITWDASYETGNASIDQQHKKLLSVVDELESAEAHTHGSSELILAVLGHVMDLTISHFAMEEDLMRRVRYPLVDREEMIQQHREFTSYARLRVLEFRRGELVSVLPLRAFLAEWLMIHEVGLDKRLADFIREQKLPASQLDDVG